MQRKYTMKNIVDWYIVEVVLSKLYMKWETIIIWTEEFLIENRIDV